MDNLPEIAGRVDRAESTLLGLDFDGTLTPIRPRPDEVIPSESAREVLARLACLPHVTPMIVSGRGLRDVTDKFGLPGLFYAGNHGLEIEGPGLKFVEPTAAATVQRLKDVTDGLRTRLAGLPGALVEPKGLTTCERRPREASSRLAGRVTHEARVPARFVDGQAELLPAVAGTPGQAA